MRGLGRTLTGAPIRVEFQRCKAFTFHHSLQIHEPLLHISRNRSNLNASLFKVTRKQRNFQQTARHGFARRLAMNTKSHSFARFHASSSFARCQVQSALCNGSSAALFGASARTFCATSSVDPLTKY
jgi:hypothetical protein